MATNTPNLNLLKKDPVVDGSDTFNIQTMLNDNWDKIDQAIGDVREELQDIDVPTASLTEAGIVRLSNSTSGTREDVAATELAVKTTYDAAVAAQSTANAANLAAAAAQTKADQAFQLGNERKAEVVAALVAKGISASTSESWDSLLSKLTSLIKATGNATAADVLSGKTFSNASGNNLTGSMPNRGAVNGTITNQNGQYPIPVGYHNGSGKVTATYKAGVSLVDYFGLMNKGGLASYALVHNGILATGRGTSAKIYNKNGTLIKEFTSADPIGGNFYYAQAGWKDKIIWADANATFWLKWCITDLNGNILQNNTAGSSYQLYRVCMDDDYIYCLLYDGSGSGSSILQVFSMSGTLIKSISSSSATVPNSSYVTEFYAMGDYLIASASNYAGVYMLNKANVAGITTFGMLNIPLIKFYPIS